MRKKLLFLFMLLTALVILMATAVVVAYDYRGRDVMGYNVLKERMFKGVVASKGDTIEGLMYFPLTRADGIEEVQIGPKEFVERSGFKLSTGDMVTVIGMRAVVNERHVVLAREVRGTNATLIVRNAMGLPLWKKPFLMDPERRTRFHEECELRQ
jgi:hypothetical protein